MIVAVKEARPITCGHFAKCGEHRGECFRRCGSLLHLGQERLIGLAYLCSFLLLIVGEKMRRTVYPCIPLLDVGPQGSRFCQSLNRNEEQQKDDAVMHTRCVLHQWFKDPLSKSTRCFSACVLFSCGAVLCDGREAHSFPCV